MIHLDQVLQDIGLSDKEARVYLACLKFPNQPTSIIAKKTTLNRGTAFVILHELLKKGLVKKTIASHVQRFSAVPPEDLLIYLDKKEFALQKQKEKIKSLLFLFKTQQGEETGKPIFQFYEGQEGLQNLLTESILGEHQEIKTILSPLYFLPSIGEEFFKEWTECRIKKGQKIFILLSAYDSQYSEFRSAKNELRETRYLPEPLVFPMTSILFKNTVLLFSHKENFGLSIQSNEFYEMQNVFFETNWAISRTQVKDDEFRMPLL